MMKYLSFFRIRFLYNLQYRTAAVSGIATQFFWGFMEIMMFQAFYRADPEAFPMTIEQVTAYVWLQQAFLALFMVWFYENELFDSVRSGNIAYELCRPADIYTMWFVRSAAARTAKAFLRCAPIVLVAFFLPENMRLVLPSSLETMLLFLLSMAFALLVIVAYSMIVYSAAFYTYNIQGVRMVAQCVAEFFTGSVIPIPFMPDSWQRWMNLLPFASMQNVPLRVYSGNISGRELVSAFGLQLFWIVVLVAIGKAMMYRGMQKVVIQGG